MLSPCRENSVVSSPPKSPKEKGWGVAETGTKKKNMGGSKKLIKLQERCPNQHTNKADRKNLKSSQKKKAKQ